MRTPPICKKPVGLGAKRVRIMGRVNRSDQKTGILPRLRNPLSSRLAGLPAVAHASKQYADRMVRAKPACIRAPALPPLVPNGKMGKNPAIVFFTPVDCLLS